MNPSTEMVLSNCNRSFINNTLKFFNKGGADFKLDSIEMSNNNLKINYGGSEEFITIGLENTDLSVSEIISHIEIIT